MVLLVTFCCPDWTVIHMNTMQFKSWHHPRQRRCFCVLCVMNEAAWCSFVINANCLVNKTITPSFHFVAIMTKYMRFWMTVWINICRSRALRNQASGQMAVSSPEMSAANWHSSVICTVYACVCLSQLKPPPPPTHTQSSGACYLFSKAEARRKDCLGLAWWRQFRLNDCSACCPSHYRKNKDGHHMHEDEASPCQMPLKKHFPFAQNSSL